MSTTHALFLAGLYALLVPPAIAADMPDSSPVQDDWKCGSQIEIVPRVTDRFKPDYIFTKRDDMPTFLAGSIVEPMGGKFSAVFIDGEDGWLGYAVEEQAGFSNVYVARQGGRAVLFSMIDVEGPGHTYTVLSTQNSFKSVACAELAAPDVELGTLDYMQIRAFDLDERGKGRLTGIVSFADERAAECFQSTTNDDGRHWSKLHRIEPCIESAYEQVSAMAAEGGSLEDLRAYSDYQ